jgi:hypothetical protein
MVDGSTVATEAAKYKIQVPNFTNLALDALKKALTETWYKLGWYDSPYFIPAVVMLAGVLLFCLILWSYIKVLR